MFKSKPKAEPKAECGHEITLKDGKATVSAYLQGTADHFIDAGTFDGSLDQARAFKTELEIAIAIASRLEGAVASLYPVKG